MCKKLDKLCVARSQMTKQNCKPIISACIVTKILSLNLPHIFCISNLHLLILFGLQLSQGFTCMDGLLPIVRSIQQTTGTMPLAPQNNINCNTRGPVELQSLRELLRTPLLFQKGINTFIFNIKRTHCYSKGI